MEVPQTDGTMRKTADLTSESDMVTVVCGDNTYFIPLNKLINDSQFFARALDVPMVEKKERKVVIKDIESGIFEKVIKFITEGKFKFNVETEAFEALEAADRLDMNKLKEEVCNCIIDNLDSENAKAVLSLAERFSAKKLFKAAFDFMQENYIKLEKDDVVENPYLALAFMEECRVKIKHLEELWSLKLWSFGGGEDMERLGGGVEAPSSPASHGSSGEVTSAMEQLTTDSNLEMDAGESALLGLGESSSTGEGGEKVKTSGDGR